MDPWHYIVLVGAVVLVGAFVLPRKKNSDVQPSQSVRNMETALDQFMENMEKDNEQLLELVAASQQASKEEANNKDKRIAALEERCEQLEQLLKETVASVAPSASGHALLSGAKAIEAPIHSVASEPQTDANRSSIQARYAELFQLYGEGKSIEMIAKKLGMNKGEVQLILGLARQEGAIHA